MTGRHTTTVIDNTKNLRITLHQAYITLHQLSLWIKFITLFTYLLIEWCDNSHSWNFCSMLCSLVGAKVPQLKLSLPF